MFVILILEVIVMPARVLLTIIETDMEHVVIKDVYIGQGGEACTVLVGYDEVKRIFYFEIYNLGGDEVLKKVYLKNGQIFVANNDGRSDFDIKLDTSEF
ncbi:MAG: hypothetical protein COS76_00735 [Candidatus Portnoybacteria bacterium CG06_land_8_20_14_3_00_39_12]|uniref:Uncharacterized protein n=3 Tax=Candidatus Portnoyibacteriota TaxID=1817913 RepID=A0A2M8KGT6_9BACT|nr:MAG: hypothetical protein AUJ33_01525 [Parcubacteria group bacterium CG1_02_40_25]PIU75447.1 MAG: hypothetical protein COS76_00735 [Candidatus Portnoybacteria bacterium CG06_land_8_20_14_3_00_39_12]PIZ71069.1 MAG: hypothetical protein COY09_01375 [Candidatus Portnoybacteria bacterium CG_4_10_14_0_2_um_filter_39_11]PJE59135.1 MAG: hypothetical protein COU83_00320 [Candidatus Portnoybacteria bacterium CG10_big_fil_rev_8_21_14_0_10_40_22]